MTDQAPLDRARPVRAGEELPLEPLTLWLLEKLPELRAPFTVEQFAKGYSNLTYLVIDSAGRELVLRRPPRGSKVKSAHDMGREVRVLSALAPLSSQFGKAPRPLAQCDDESVIGVPFYVMDRLRGTILRGPTPPVPIPPEEKRAIDSALVDTLVALHALDVRAPALAALGKPEGYVERQVSGWTRRYADAKTDDVPEIEEAARWLAAHLPRESGAALIHNDFKFDNVVLSSQNLTQVLGVLDWEMATVGDPLLDLGTALAYWVEEGDRDELRTFAFGPTYLPGSFTRREFAQAYALKSGRDVGDLSFYLSFALFKNAVVAQQIYARYKAGLTQDERFAMLGYWVKLLAEESLRVSAQGHI